jgi:hypothetical protein
VIIPKPLREFSTAAERAKLKVDGPFDTPTDKALEVTYTGENFAAIKREFERQITEKERIEALLVF